MSLKFISRCKQYGALPSTCQKVPDPQGCCELVVCQDPTPGPSPTLCPDAIPDCSSYGSPGKDGCVGAYEGWARINCPGTCGYCGKFSKYNYIVVVFLLKTKCPSCV